MNAVLALLLLNAVLGAWDTLWYHEYRGRLTAKLHHTRPELRLHAVRDALYVVLYGWLAWWQPTGIVVLAVTALLIAEVCITLVDFVVEDRDRPVIGGMVPGERILHTLMAIVYGVMLAQLLPILWANFLLPSDIVRHDADLPLSLAATAAAIGIAMSGTRDTLALFGIDPLWSRTRRLEDC